MMRAQKKSKFVERDQKDKAWVESQLMSEHSHSSYDKVIIEWLDAYEMESGWQTIEEAKITPPKSLVWALFLKKRKSL